MKLTELFGKSNAKLAILVESCISFFQFAYRRLEIYFLYMYMLRACGEPADRVYAIFTFGSVALSAHERVGEVVSTECHEISREPLTLRGQTDKSIVRCT